MKCHTGVDAGSGFVHTVEATAVNVHDVTEAEKLLREDGEVVYGDSTYLGFMNVVFQIFRIHFRCFTCGVLAFLIVSCGQAGRQPFCWGIEKSLLEYNYFDSCNVGIKSVLSAVEQGD